MKRQKAFDEYLKLHQQKEQTALKYLRELKDQLLKLNDDVCRSEALFMKFQLKLLSSNKDCLALLPSKNNYNVNEQAAWVTQNKRTNLELLSQSQHQDHSQTTTIKEISATSTQNLLTNQQRIMNQFKSHESERVCVSDNEIQRQKTADLCLKCEEVNHKASACLKE